MTPKEKASNLIKKYDCGGLITFAGHSTKKISIQCALIATDEIIESIKECADKDIINIHLIYWRKVKDEILKLSKQ